jgi:hypothetical protein
LAASIAAERSSSFYAVALPLAAPLHRALPRIKKDALADQKRGKGGAAKKTR